VPTASAGFGPLPETDTDHDTVNDKSVLKNVAGDILKGFSSVWTPVTTTNAAGASTRIGSLLTVGSITDNFGDTVNDTGTDVGSSDTTSSPGGGVTVTPPGGSPITLVPVPAGVLTDNFSDDMQDQTQTRGYSVFNTTDPTTGVQTNIIAGDVGQGTFNDQSSDNSTGLPGNVAFSASGSGSTGNTPGAPPFSDTAKDNASSTFSDRGPLDINVQGSPQAGETVNVGADLILSDSGQAGDNGQDTSTAPGKDSGGVNFQSSDDASVGGRTNATMTNNVSTNDGKGSTVISTDTFTDNGTVGAMDHNDDKGQDNFSDANDQPTSDSEGDTDNTNALAQATEKGLENFTGTFATVDPTTGLQVTVGMTNNVSAGETDLGNDTRKDIHNASGTSTVSNSDDISFDDKVLGSGNSSDSATALVSTTGTDSQGDQVNIKGTLTFQGNATSSSSDEDTGEDDISSAGGEIGGDTETVAANVQAHGTSSDAFHGTIVRVDPSTGIKTAITEDMAVNASDNEYDHEDETDIRSESGSGAPSESDTTSQTDTESRSTGWNASGNVTQTDSSGAAVGTAGITSDTGSDAITTSVLLAVAADGTVTSTPAGTETGTDTSSDPVAGTTTWSSRPLSQAALSQFASGSVLMGGQSALGAGSSPTGSQGGSGSTGSGSSSSTTTTKGFFARFTGATAAMLRELREAVTDAQQELATENALMDAKIKSMTAMPVSVGTVYNSIVGFCTKVATEVPIRILSLGEGSYQLVNDIAELRSQKALNSAGAAGTSAATTILQPIAEYVDTAIDPTGMGPLHTDFAAEFQLWSDGATIIDPTMARNGETGAYIYLFISGVAGVEAEVAAMGATKFGNVQMPLSQERLGQARRFTGRTVWDQGPTVRGEIIERRLGQNLPRSFPTIDKFNNGIATSIKSMNLNDPTYLKLRNISRVGERYVDQLAAFTRGKRGRLVILPQQIQGRVLELAIPRGASDSQLEALEDLVRYGLRNGVIVVIIEI
jgi:hypothetical protein